jgi:protein required for attachment to host cells
MSRHWIVVADASRARIVDANDLRQEPRLVYELDHAPGRARVQELVSSDRGRSRGGPDSDPHRVESRNFARKLAAVLQTGLRDRDYERIVLCAPAHFLGDLRRELSREVARCVVASLSHDWTGEPLHALPEVVRRAIDRPAARAVGGRS